MTCTRMMSEKAGRQMISSLFRALFYFIFQQQQQSSLSSIFQNKNISKKWGLF
jgi:hypothetical protein